MYYPTASCLAQTVRRVAGQVTDPNVTAINAEGWSVQYTSPPTFNPVTTPKYVVASRPGYDASANTTTYTDNLIITQRVRQAYPSQASLDANRCSLTDYIYSTDTVAGVTNNSTQTSPKPVCGWAMPPTALVANTVNLEVVAFHRDARNGREVASVKFIATDGSTTVSQTVSATTVSGRTGDQSAVVVYACALDISTLTDQGLITVNAEVYPWIGQSGSVCKSADSSVKREFSPRYFYKDTARFASPPLAYVQVGGVDASGAWSTTDATARASPFLTVQGAINAIATQSGVTGGFVDGCEVHVGAGTFVLTSAASTRNQKCAPVRITRDTASARALCIVSFGLAAYRPRLGGTLISPVDEGAFLFDDISILRTGTNTFQGETTPECKIIFNNVAFDNASQNSTWLNHSHNYWYGATITNLAVSTISAGTYEQRIFRGVTVDTNFGNIEGWLHLGSTYTRPALSWGTRAVSGTIHAFNKWLNTSSVNGLVDPSTTENIVGFAYVQNLVEVIYASVTPFTFRHNGDTPASGSSTHLICHHNTLTGFFTGGRCNVLYDNTVAASRSSKLQSFKGNIWCQINTKGDVESTTAANVGNWGYLYAAGCQGEFTQFIDAQGLGIGTSFAQAYFGLGANYGTSSTVRNDPLFTNYQGTTSGPTAGAGGGDYTLQNTSPCKAMVTNPVLAFDLAGTARGTIVDSAGAYYHA